MEHVRYLALTAMTAKWLLRNTEVLYALADAFVAGALADEDTDVFADPARIVGDRDVLALLHAEHVNATSDEPIGFIRIAGPHSIAADEALARRALAQAVALVQRRVQGRVLDDESDVVHGPGGVRSVIIDESTEYRPRLLLCWAERALPAYVGSRAVILCGPVADDIGGDDVLSEMRRLDSLLRSARSIRRNPPTEGGSASATPSLLAAIRQTAPRVAPRPFEVTELARRPELTAEQIERANRWTYDEWSDPATSSLSPEQMHILLDDAIVRHPLRLFGPAGSGKTLLMQLMAIRRLSEPHARVLYVTHNKSMEERVTQRFETLEAHDAMATDRLVVSTLSGLAMKLLQLKSTHLLELDPEAAKRAAFETLDEALDEALSANVEIVQRSGTLRPLAKTRTSRRHLLEYLRSEISFAIKGRGATLERSDYTGAEGNLGTLHALLTPAERNVVYDAFESYQRRIEGYGAMDADDVAATLLSQLSGPKWRIDRPSDGYDFVFVDEAQLFNDNERRVFSMLTNLRFAHTPIAVALDEAQRLYDPPASGAAWYGMSEATRETLHIGHRLSESIAQLAFFIIAESTILYERAFPDYRTIILPDEQRRGVARLPQLVTTAHMESRVRRIIEQMIREGMREIAVIAHTEPAYSRLSTGLTNNVGVHFSEVEHRGQPTESSEPYVVLSRPPLIGGQEFDCVISCGLEEGLVPPKAQDGRLDARLKEQALREMYLVFTRARHQLFIVNFSGRAPSPILARAASAQHQYIDIRPEGA